ncbi:MAG: shikimate dehydrogenase [Nocardioidaceae bacterium]|nr:shikimate dehydrogenase [Nocardioidaceae bacterium]
MLGQSRRCAVLGSPIKHSLSPVLHRAAYEALGLDWSYEAIEVDSSSLEGFLDQLSAPWRGLSLTMPLKRTVMSLLTDVDDWARRSGAANTVVLESGRRHGHNTDVTGAMAALVELDLGFKRVTILGAGATAASIGLAVAELGARQIVVAARNAANAEDTFMRIRAHPNAPEVTLAAIDQPVDTELLVSTIPASAQPALQVRAVESVFEVIYDPWPTPLAKLAAERECPLIDGLDLLAHQAVGQVLLMTGESVPVDVLRTAGRLALEAR